MTPAKPLDDNDELMSLAATGGVIRTGNEVINAAGNVLPMTRPARTTEPPAPARVEAGMSDERWRALMDERDERWREHADSLQRQIDILAQMVQVAQQRKPPTWRLTQTTDPETGAILEITATPVVA